MSKKTVGLVVCLLLVPATMAAHFFFYTTSAESQSATTTASEQDVKTNPQSEVGGIEEVNQLFGEENIGAETVVDPVQENKWLLPVGLGVVSTLALLAAILLILKIRSVPNDN